MIMFFQLQKTFYHLQHIKNTLITYRQIRGRHGFMTHPYIFR